MPYGRTPSPRKGTGGWSSRAAYRRAQRMKHHREGGPVEGYKKGGKVRGAGIAQRGVRPAKMR